MAKVHDRGGRQDAGPIPMAEHHYTLWEKRTHALSNLLRRKMDLYKVDEKRRTLESMEPAQYESLRYYERWVVATESLLVEKGAMTSQEIDREQRERARVHTVPVPAGHAAEEHDHEHLPEDTRTELNPWEARIDAILSLLDQRGLITADEIRREVEAMDSRDPAQGARIVARAWADPAFKSRLMADAKAAVAELGIDASALNHLVVLENTERLHHMIVCTLCSCYPTPILGLPPDWYKSLAYRSRAVSEPRSVLREFGLDLEPDVEVRVVDSTADTRYLVLPVRPAGTENLGEQELAALVTRDCMVGVASPRA